MKRILLITLALLNSLDMIAGITIRIEATFGAKRRGCLSGLGLCSAKTSKAEQPDRQVTLSMSPDERAIIMIMDAELLAEHDGQVAANRFIQEEDFLLPDEVSEALGLPGMIQIPAGDYPASVSSRAITVTFPVGVMPGVIR